VFRGNGLCFRQDVRGALVITFGNGAICRFEQAT